MADKECLGSGGWLNDKHIHAAQQLLKKENPYVGGLQDPILQTAHSFEIEGGEFVQILHMNNNHWITISSIGCSPGYIKLYDSMQHPIPSSIKHTIAELIHTQCKQITIEHVNMQVQQGESECGLFAIAIATALCHGQDPHQIEFAQGQMRKHLLNALEMENISPFPYKLVSRDKKVLRKEYIRVYCTCRLPDNGSQMVQCSECSMWYHVHCVQCPRSVLKKKNEPWSCENCV